MDRSGLTYCLIQLFKEMVGSFGEAILNDIDCPHLTLTKQLLLVPPSALVCAVTSAAAPAPRKNSPIDSFYLNMSGTMTCMPTTSTVCPMIIVVNF